MSTTKVITGKVRFSYVNIFKSRAFQAGQDAKYSVCLLIPKEDKATIKKIKAAIDAAVQDGISSKWGGKKPANLKLPLRDGDAERADEAPEYEGMYFLNCNSTQKPGIVDKDLNEILDPDEVYSGCWGRAYKARRTTMEPITIRWETGYMTINPDAFFPTSAARIRKLLRVVALDFEHQDDIRMQLAGACESRAQEILDGRKSLANEAVNHHQKAADLEPQIETAKRRITTLRACIKEQPKKARQLGYPERLHNEREQLKKLTAERSGALSAFRKKKREFEAAEATAEKLRQNAEVLRP